MRGSGTRRVLFLQGATSPFWAELGGAFEAAGHEVFKINFCVADWVFWRRDGPVVNYKGSVEDWPSFLAEYLDAHGITDVLYYADQIPYHACVPSLAKPRGVETYALEYGYVRPDWITLEKGGTGAFSHFPNDPEKIRGIAEQVEKPDLSIRYRHNFSTEAFYEVSFNLLDVLFPFFFPRYRADKFYHPLLDYGSWLMRLPRARELKRHANRVCMKCFTEEWSYYLVALQLQSDYQIRSNSHYLHLREMMKDVIRSFAAHAPKNSKLIFKVHPLDNGYENWARRVAHRARRLGVRTRVFVIEDGPLGSLVNNSKGVIVCNSTVGVLSLRALRPTMVMGEAVYDMPGLTHQGNLDTFWTAAEDVDSRLAGDFVRAMTATIQVKGSFYNREGRKAAQQEIVRRVVAGEVNRFGAYVETPPRVARLRARREKRRAAGLQAAKSGEAGPPAPIEPVNS